MKTVIKIMVILSLITFPFFFYTCGTLDKKSYDGVNLTSSRPFATTYTPRDGDTNVSINVVGTVTFSEAMDTSTITTNTSNGTCLGSIQISKDDFVTCIAASSQPVASNNGKTFTLTPQGSLLTNTLYKAKITTGATDLDGSSFLTLRSTIDGWTTGNSTDNSSPSVSSITPSNGTTSVSLNILPVVQFNETMEPSSITANTASTSCSIGTFLLSKDNFTTCVQASQGISVGNNNKSFTFTPSANLAASTTYQIKILSTVKDASNVAMGTDYLSSFTTGTTSDTTAPTVSSTSPASSATGIAVTSTIQATFSEDLDSASVSTTSFTLKQGSTPVLGLVTTSGNTTTFTPSDNLSTSTTYTATLTTSVTDTTGNALASNYSWSFTTSNSSSSSSITLPDGSSWIQATASAEGVKVNDLLLFPTEIP